MKKGKMKKLLVKYFQRRGSMLCKLKNIIVAIIALSMILCLCSCSKNNDGVKVDSGVSQKIDIETFLALKNKNDVQKCFGNPLPTEEGYEEYEHYDDIVFMDNNLSIMACYEDENLHSIGLTYYFVGMQDLELAKDMMAYVPSVVDVKNAENFIVEIVDDFTEKFGEPEVFNSPVNTTTYTWTLDGCEIKVQDCIDSDPLRLTGAINIDLNY